MGVDSFLDKCVDNFETKMDTAFYSAKDVAEFITAHNTIKCQVIAELPALWRKEFGSQPIPGDIEIQLEKNIEDTYKQLKRHFEKSKAREQNQLSAVSAQQDAIKFYNEEMDKYFLNHPSASPKEINMHHDGVYMKTITGAKKTGGVAMTSSLLQSLKTEIEKRRKLYYNKALMSMRTLKDPAIGIDLGTTMCCVMVFHKGKVEIVPNRVQSSRSTTPSYVAYHEDGTSTFGWVAKEASYRFPETTIYDAKRMIGRKWTDQKLQEDRAKWPFQVVNDSDHPKVLTFGKKRYPHEVSARLLAHFRVMAEKHLNLPQGSVRKAVITVPAYFTEPQRRATNEAAMCAGLEVLNILSEPTAAAIAYSWERTDADSRKALIYDLGGGTFDVAIADVNGERVEILGVAGDTHLGGQDFDNLLMEFCIDEFRRTHGVDLLAGKSKKMGFTWSVQNKSFSALSRLRSQCEKAKEALSTGESAVVDVNEIHKKINLTITISRKKLNDIVRPLIQKTLDIVTNALNDAKAKGLKGKQDIQDVILVGGSTRMPLVIDMLKEYFDGKELCQSINPDEAVAYGAAAQAAIINKEEGVRKVTIQDVTPMTLGIDNHLDGFSRIIPKNSKIPCTFDKIHCTLKDNQKNMLFNVYQGEDDTASKNKWLGKFVLHGLPLLPKHQATAHITMTIDSMGILQVEAVQPITGSSNTITITSDKLGMNENAISELKIEFSRPETE